MWFVWKSTALRIAIYLSLVTSNIRSQPVPGTTTINGTDGRITYDPKLSDPVWWNHHHMNVTNSTDASAKVWFIGTRVEMLAVPGTNFASLNVTRISNGNNRSSTSVFGFQREDGDEDKDTRKITLFSNLDGAVTHNIIIEKNTSDPDSLGGYWGILNLIIYGQLIPPTVQPTMLSIIQRNTGHLPPTPNDPSTTSTYSNSSNNTTNTSNNISTGTKVGAAVSSITGTIIIGTGALFLYRRHKKALFLTPEPLVIPPVRPKQDRSRFRRMYSTHLPHFKTPSSFWPSTIASEINPTTPTKAVDPESLHERITPFNLPPPPPPPPPLAVKPRPERHRRRRHNHPNHSPFFVMNPSSQSQRSQSSENHGSRTGYVRTAIADVEQITDALHPGSTLSSVYVEPTPEEKARRRIEKGKQKAVDFEIDSLPERRKATRSQSIRRFFTTNPNPSTSSSSSTSSRRSKSSRGASVAGYVRSQIRQRTGLGSEPISELTPVPFEMPKPPPQVRRVSRPLPIPKPLMVEKGSVAPPRRLDPGQVRFFTTNPSVVSEKTDADSVTSVNPPPRKDKGKRRAYDLD